MDKNSQIIKQIKKIKHDQIIYSINTEEKTASISDCENGVVHKLIPKSFFYESSEYIITSISALAFAESNLESIQFADDSQLQKIEENVFPDSIFHITIPSTVRELKNGWCFHTPKLNSIDISPDNPYFLKYDDKFIIGKSSIEKDNYDQLLFCVRNVETVTLPNFIEYICPYAFEKCENLQNITIPNDSKLKTIDEYAFCETKIENFRIPSQLIELKQRCLIGMSKLTKISVDPNNRKFCCLDDKFIIGKSSIEQKNYDQLLFCVHDAETVTIPTFIEYICSYTFYKCHKLKNVEIPKESNLKIIGDYAFEGIPIKKINIPSTVTKIGKYAFSYCRQIKQIEIPNDSKLEIIDEFAFRESSIDCITIPSKLIELKKYWCLSTSQLININISPNNPRFCCLNGIFIIGKSSIEQENYDEFVFSVRNIKSVEIPNYIENICSCAFDECKQLRFIKIPNDSKLQNIDDYSFSETSIKTIRIPSKVTRIGKHTFSYCKKLQYIEFENNSKLQIIDNFAFLASSIEKIKIPSKVTRIGKRTFSHCKKLKHIDIESDSELQVIDDLAFFYSTIKSFSITSKVKKISDNAFHNCEYLQIIEICDNSSIEVPSLKFFLISKCAVLMISANLINFFGLKDQQESYNESFSANNY